MAVTKGDHDFDGNITPIQIDSVTTSTYKKRAVAFTLGTKSEDLAITDKSYKWVSPVSGTITKVLADVITAPTGANLISDVNINGTSIWNTTQANRVTITATNVSGNQTSFDSSSISVGDIITIDVDQVGSTIAGQDLTITVEYSIN